MRNANQTPREAYLAKLGRDAKRSAARTAGVSRYFSLKLVAADMGFAVCRLMCCGHDQASYFFYRLDDTKAAAGGYTVRNSTTHLNPDAPRGVPSQFVRNYQEAGRAEGLDQAFRFLEQKEG